MLSNIGQEVVARFGISTPVVLAGPHTVIFSKTRKKGSCPHSYYARLQLKRIFVRKKDYHTAAFFCYDLDYSSTSPNKAI